MLNRERSQSIFNRAMNVLTQGVSSNFRYWGPDNTPVLKSGKGAKVWDADGLSLIHI